MARPQGVVLTGSGTVFKLRVDGNTKAGRRGRPGRHNSNSETVLYSFGGPSDGANPLAGLAFDAAGNLYGTTSVGGSSGNGTVFELAPPVQGSGTWTENVLYSFGTGTDGANPVGGVTWTPPAIFTARLPREGLAVWAQFFS